ncbi:cilium assembly protein DZIP1L [Culicoides brevitarsis]|uniref:cilium assembly protein DZIP1L n=1 Tax=Culicoides brevitarsis TaxID=469753 RepID=UPI00307C0060
MSIIEKASASWKHDFTQLARESGFQFRHLHASGTGAAFFDWKEIDNIDVDKIISDRDFQAVDRLLPHLMEAPIGSLVHNRILDPNIRKYLQLTQLAMQYLVFCKKFLDKTVFGLHSAINDSSKDNAKLGRILKRKNQEIQSLQVKLRDLEENVKYDSKRGHVPRKQHFEGIDDKNSPPTTPTPVAVTDKSLISTIKLELEVKQLKERLNAAEKDLQEQRVNNFQRNNVRECQHSTVESGVQTKIEENSKETSKRSSRNELKVESKSKFGSTESLKSQEEVVSVKRLNELMREQTKMIEQLRENERNSYKNELSELRSGFKEAFQSLKSSIDMKLADIQKDHKSQELLKSSNLREKSPSPMASPKVQRKLPQTTSIEENLTKIGKIDEVMREEHEHWETRFSKLERIFEQNQEMMSNSLQNMSQMYSNKFNTLEKTIKDASLKQLKHEITQSEPMLVKKVEERGRPNVTKVTSAKEIVVKGASSPRKLSPASSPRKTSPSPTRREIPSSPVKPPTEKKLPSVVKIVKPVSPEPPKNVSKGAIPKKPVKTPTPIPETKFKKNEKKVLPNPTVKITRPSITEHHPIKNSFKAGTTDTHVDNPAESQFDIFMSFRNRLKKYGIKHTNKSLSTPQMLAIKSQLVQERLKSKKKSSLFSTIRSRLSSQVSKEAKSRLAKLKTDDRYAKEDSSDRFECTKHNSNNIEDIIEENSSSSSSNSDSEVVIVAKAVQKSQKLPPLREQNNSPRVSPKPSPQASPRAKPRTTNLTKTSPLKLSTESIFDISESALTSTKLEDQLRRVLDSPIRRPSYPKEHMMKNPVDMNAKVAQANAAATQKRVNFSTSQPLVSSFHEKSPQKSNNYSHVSLTNLSDDSDFNFSHYK